MEDLKRVVIKEELVALTGDFKKAIILNQFLYWSKRVKDFDKFILEEKERYSKEDIIINQPLTNGWIYKSSEELSQETMIGLSKSNMRAHIKFLVDNEWLEERSNPNLKWDRTLQYRVNIVKIQKDLQDLGYALEGYPLLINQPCSKTEHVENQDIDATEHPCSKIEHHSSKTEFDKFCFETAIPEITSEITSEIIITTETPKGAVVAQQEEIILNNTNIKELTDHQKKKVSTWDIDTLIRAIQIYKDLNGLYFKLLEKIYKDGAKESLVTKKQPKESIFNKTYSHNWDLEALERIDRQITFGESIEDIR